MGKLVCNEAEATVLRTRPTFKPFVSQRRAESGGCRTDYFSLATTIEGVYPNGFRAREGSMEDNCCRGLWVAAGDK